MIGFTTDGARWMTDAARVVLEDCRARGWKTDWSARGCYLHLEASELIEALRGKGDSTPTEEAADVLRVFLSIVGAFGIGPGEIFRELDRKLALPVTP